METIFPFLALSLLILSIILTFLFLCFLAAWALQVIETFVAKRLLVIFFALFAALISFFHFAGLLGNSTARLERDHGIVLPYSVSHIQCKNLLSLTTFADIRASASFEMARSDLDSFLYQFHGSLSTPLPDDYSLASPRDFRGITASYRGLSREGHMFRLDIHDVDADTIGVCIDTFWN